MEKQFSHEKLIVYQRLLDFVEFIENILSKMIDKLNVYEQIYKCSTSIPLNIAEGTGKFSAKDKNKYYDIARGSATECAACLDVMFKRKRITEEENNKGKEILYEIVSMLVGLVRSNTDQVYEEGENYDVDKEIL